MKVLIGIFFKIWFIVIVVVICRMRVNVFCVIDVVLKVGVLELCYLKKESFR